MSDLNWQLALDVLSAKVEGVTPRVLPTFPFKRYQGAAPLEASDESSIRAFEWREEAWIYGQAQANGEEAWYQPTVKLLISYPTQLLIPGDTTVRGLAGMRGADVIDLNKALSFDNPLGDSGGPSSYTFLDFLGARLEGRLLAILYSFSITEGIV